MKWDLVEDLQNFLLKKLYLSDTIHKHKWPCSNSATVQEVSKRKKTEDMLCVQQHTELHHCGSRWATKTIHSTSLSIFLLLLSKSCLKVYVLMLASHLSKTENKIFTWYFWYCTHGRYTYFNIGFATVKLILSSSSVFPSYVSKLVCTLIIISFLEYMFIMYVYNINY